MEEQGESRQGKRGRKWDLKWRKRRNGTGIGEEKGGGEERVN